MTPAQRSEVIWTPLKLWAALLALLVATIVYAYLPGVPLKTPMGLAIGATKAAIIALFFMQLRTATALVRIAAVAGLAWVTFLYILSFADVLTR